MIDDNQVIIRNMTVDDVDAVYDIAVRSFSDPWNVESFNYSIKSESDYCMVAESCGCVAGYFILRISYETADVTDIAVDVNMRKKGIGKLLMEALFNKGNLKGVQRFALEVRQSNIAAISLYESCGFHADGIRKSYYSSPKEDAVLMWYER